MEIKELTERMLELVHQKGWDGATSRRPQTPRNLAVSISIEASEILEHFQWQDDPKNPDKLAEELADVFLYLVQLASVSRIDLEHAILLKLKTNTTREWDE